MFQLSVKKNTITLVRKETITSGSVNVYNVEFEFDEDWKPEYLRYAIFKVGSQVATIELGENNQCEIPWELTTSKQANISMYCGVCGRLEDGTEILPTIWVELGNIQEGVRIEDNVCRPPHKSAYDEVLDALKSKGDNITFQDKTLSLNSGENVLSTVEIEAGGGEAPDEIESLEILKIWKGGI